MKHRSVNELFQEVAQGTAEKTAYCYKARGRWVHVSWAEQRAVVARVSKSLIALGVAKGDCVGILAQTRLEWVQCDLGAVNCGAVTVGVYPTLLADGCAYILNHSDCLIVFAENLAQMEKILSVRSELPRLRHIVLVEGKTDEPGILHWEEFLEQGDGLPDAELDSRAAALERDDLASLVYTSGTTGLPKGVMITHGNLLFTSWSVSESLYSEPDFDSFLFLPLAHVYARLMIYSCLQKGNPVFFAEDITKVAENIREVRPHYFPSVPRVYEKIYDKIVSTAEAAGGLKTRLFHWAVGVGTQVSERKQRGEPIPPLLKLRHALAHRLVLHKIVDAFGGRLVYAISGAAPLNEAIARFFHACGVLILEGIGMTENSSFSNVNRIDWNKFGTVGPLGPGIEMKLADDGEVLFRGPNVMKGYFKDPQATAETINAEGWLHTGDIGEIDDDGFLKITDRKKDLIVTAGGKNVAPQRIERILRSSHYISHAVAFGDRKKYLTALVTLDPENIDNWARRHGLDSADREALAADPRVRELIEAEIEKCNGQLASFETIKRFQILPTDFSIDSGELTPTLKIKRKVVVANYRDQLQALYDD